MSLRVLASCSALVTVCACADGTPPQARPNVVLVCMDTVRADHLGTYGYARATTPELDGLAERSIVFERATATAGWTKPSVPSYLTGTYPLQHGVYEGSARGVAGEVTDVLPAGAVTLTEVLRDAGYRTAAFVHNAQLRHGNGFEQGFETYVEENMDAREIRWRGLDWIDERDERPFFLYLHFLDAHWPYEAPEPWTTRFAPADATAPFRGKQSKPLIEAINDGERALTEDDRAALEALYDGALAYLDHELGRLLHGLELRGLDEETIVCVVADHGEEFGEHGRVGHGHGLWEDLLHVPWILRVPGRQPRRHPGPVSLVDLFPTLLGAAGVPVPATHEGVDRLDRPELARPILAEHKGPDSYAQTLREGDRKLHRKARVARGESPAALLLPVEVGTRWEAELVPEGGELVVTQLKPRDEDADDPPELKGAIEEVSATELRIAGVRVRYDDRTVRQVEAGTAGPELAVGQVVKVRGPCAGGVLAAERIRFYAPAESRQLEIRATVDAIEQRADGHGALSLGGFRLVLTPDSELKDAERRAARPRLAREAIVELVRDGFDGASQLEVERWLHDLARDPGELAPLAAEHGSALESALDELAGALVERRLFGAGDQRVLDDAALRDLEAIGYGGDGE